MATAVPPPAGQVPSEEILARKTDVCLSNAIVKTAIGAGTGVVLSALLFRRRLWPVWLLTGAGLGAAYTECNISFNPTAIPGYRVASASQAQQSVPKS